MQRKRSALAAFVLAGAAAGTAAATWLVGIVEAREVAAACSKYNIFAEAALCRWPALYGAIGWILFTGAIASAWVGGVRLARNATSAARAEKDRNAPAPRDAHPTA